MSGPPAGLSTSLTQRVLDGSTPHPEPVTGVAAADAARATSSSAATTSAAPALDPARIRDRIDALIDNQITAGRITGDQGGVLRQLLTAPEAGAAAGPADAAAAQPASSASTGTAGAPQDPAASSDARLSPSETLASFIQQMQRTQSRTIGYGSDGARNTDVTSSRLLDFNT
ncbi:hypothetical protein LOK46_25800 [Methylobacterium sp. NMS14P]|uniref:hypothetical protein n=1 Tax=Methylobacterium sp. NMS14P TaxID=2894310 RepID=UPI0023594E32|nr:hypothetical protein [Methylobacterium sp. NMS14P]WCS24502.1 hypothetical protein LOK46_25800 [Methylobacterium sp. NMS14P]